MKPIDPSQLHTYEVPPKPCPCCGKDLSTKVSTLDEHQPEKGDITICKNCGEFLVFNEDLSAHEITLAELMSVQPQEMDLMTHAQKVIRENPEAFS